MRLSGVWLVLATLAASPAAGGAFIKSDRCPFDPFIIIHPAGYDGTGGEITLRVCLAPSTPDFILPALQTAIDRWNGFVAIAPNCQGCLTQEELGASEPPEPYDLASGLLHELGHCAFGLGHPNQFGTSFTSSRRDCPNPPPDPLPPPPVVFDEGADGIAGSFDDLVFPNPGTRILHWFRIADNNPAAIDTTIIDQNTYSRRRVDLPAGHNWPANANRVVADALGFSNTHAVMYGGLARGATFTGFSGDDIATAEFGVSGLDIEASTADDYSVTLAFEPDCASADIELRYRSFAGEPELENTLLLCTADIQETEPPPPGQSPQHFTVAPPVGLFDRITLEIDSRQPWGDVVFVDSFESGDLTQWSDSVEP